MPEAARIFLVDDDDDSREITKLFLTKHGHKIVRETNTLEKALIAVKFAIRERINVAVLDRFLTPNTTEDEGKIIDQALRERMPDIKTVCYSSVPAYWANARVTRGELDELCQIVTKL